MAELWRSDGGSGVRKVPFVLIALGILFLVVAVQGTQGSLFALLKSEFVGTNSFIPWVAAFVILGLAGYIKPIRPVTHAFLALLFLVLVLVNGKGFFAKFNAAIKNPVAPSVGSNALTGLLSQPQTVAGSTIQTPGGAVPTPNYSATGSALPQAWAPPGG